MKKICKIIGVLLVFFVFAISCSEDATEILSNKSEELIFTTDVKKWGEEEKEVQTENNAKSRIRIVPVETAGDIGLFAIYGEKTDQIQSSANELRTRAAILNNGIETTEKFKLAAYYDSLGIEKTLIDEEEIVYSKTENGVDYWKINTTDENAKVYWKLGSMAITTYAWWPIANADGVTYNNVTKTIDDYEVSEDALNQKDLLYAYVPPTYYTVHESAPITFNHALTAVQFVMGQGFSDVDGHTSGKVVKIELQNLFYKGTFNMSTGTWDVDNTARRNFIMNIDADDAAPFDETHPNVVINDGVYTFLMMPQDLSESPCLAIFTMADGNVFRATLNHAGIWRPGAAVRYLLTGQISNGYVIYASSQEAPYTGSDGTDADNGSISVVSYQLNGTVPDPQKWKVTGYSIDEGVTWNTPNASIWTGSGKTPVNAWLRAGDGSSLIEGKAVGEGHGMDVVTVPLNVDHALLAQGTGIGEEINNALKNASPVSDHDLYSDKNESANCYIISAAGSYKFPAVYGNSLKNGQNNTSAYNLTDFVNYLGNRISKPSIKEDTGVTPSYAQIIWEEGAISDVITDVTYNPSDNYVYFNINRDNIYQGNAVIGLFDSNDVCMWSWHIWITTAYTKIARVTNGSYTFAPTEIGFLFMGRTSTFAARSVMLRIQQVDDDGNVIMGSSSCKAYISQSGGNEESRCVGCVYYQWGRKDPRPSPYNYYRPSNFTWDNDLNRRYQEQPAAYQAANERATNFNGYNWNEYGTQISMQVAIRHPEMFKYKFDSYPNQDWCSMTRYHWWNAKVNATSGSDVQTTVTKTVYDPSPAGYKVPPMAAFAGLKDGIKSTIIDHNGHTTLVYWDCGSFRSYYTGRYYRTTGTGALSYLEELAYFSGTSTSSYYALQYRMYNNGKNWYPGGTSGHRSDGISVRPILDN